MHRSRLVPRFTLRRLMVAVAIIGLIVGGWCEIERRRKRFRKLAAAHFILTPGTHCFAADDELVLRLMRQDRLIWRENYDIYHWQMYEKYEEMTRHPWLPEPE